MTQPKRETVGKLSAELLKSASQNSHSAADQGSEHLQDYEKNINLAIKQGLKDFDGDFFVVVLMKRERLMQNVMRLYFFPRQSCPTPQHEQVVYHYHRTTGEIEYLWTVPSLEACTVLINEALNVHDEEKHLLQHVLDFKDGTLLRKAQILNNEPYEDLIIV